MLLTALTALAAVAIGDARALSVSESCEVPTWLGSVPADGDQGLPADTVLTLLFDGSPSCGAPEVVVRLRRHGGSDVEATLAVEGDGVVRVIPDEPLADGTYVAEVELQAEDPVALTFGVGGSFPLSAPGEPGDLVLGAGRSCDQIMVSRVVLEATFPTASPADRGLLRAQIFTEDGGAGSVAALYTGETAVKLEDQVLGGRELCVALSLEDVTGALVWELEPICAEEHPGCAFDQAIPRVRGCSSAPLGGLLLLPLVLLATRRRGLAGGALLGGCSGPTDDRFDTGLVPITSTVTVDVDGLDADALPPVDGPWAPPENLGNERTWCWTLATRRDDLVLYAIGADSGTLVQVQRYPDLGSSSPVSALVVLDDRLVGARSGTWLELQRDGGVRTATMHGWFESGLAVIDDDLVAVSLRDRRKTYPDFDALAAGEPTSSHAGFAGLSNFTADGADLIGTETWADRLTVRDGRSGALLAEIPLAGQEQHVDGLSMAGGMLHLLDAVGQPAWLHRIDPPSGERLSRVEVAGPGDFRPGGLWCDAR